MISRLSTTHTRRPARHLVRQALVVIALLGSIQSVPVGTPTSPTRVAGTLYPCGGVCSPTTVSGAQAVV